MQLKLYSEVSVPAGLTLPNTVTLAVVWNTLGVSPPWLLPYGVVIPVLWGFQGRHCSPSSSKVLPLAVLFKNFLFY